jgi:hypothetical protein
MKEILFNNKKYNLPQAWSEVTIAMLIKSEKLLELLEDSPIVVIISSYTGIPIKELKVSNVKEVQEVINIMSFITEPYEPQQRIEFTYNNEVYQCAEDLTEQKFEDFVSIQTALYNHRDQPTKALPKLLAIYCKKENETLDSFDLNVRAKEFEQLPMTIAKDIEAFFLSSINAYNTITNLSSNPNIMRDIVLEHCKELTNTMKAYKERHGGSFFTRLRIGYYQIQLWWVSKVLAKYFNSSPVNE